MKGARLTLFLVVLFTVVGFTIYSNVLAKTIFIFDDFEYVVDNPIIQNLSLFDNMTDPRHIGYLSFAMNYAIGGQDPFGFHLVNIVIHIVNAVLVFFLVRLLLKVLSWSSFGTKADSSEREGMSETADLKETDIAVSEETGTTAAGEAAATAPQPVILRDEGFGNNTAVAFIAALIFLVHPIETQAVSYITQRFTSLSAFFYIVSVLSYFVSRVRLEEGQRGFKAYWPYILSLSSTVLAMKTKEISFTIPVTIAVFEYLIFKGSIFSSRRFYYLIPFAAALVIIPVSLLGPEWGLMDPGFGVDEVTRKDKLYDLYERAPDEYLFTQFRVIVTYIRLFFLPTNQLVTYDYRASHTFFEPSVILSLLLLMAVAAGGLYSWKKAGRSNSEEAPLLRLASLGILWFFMTLSIESSAIPIKDMIFEHRMYLPSIGFFTSASVALFLLAGKIPKNVSRPLKAAGIAVIIAVLFSGITYTRNDIWTSEIKFWDDVVRKTGKAIGYNNRGNAYLHAGMLEPALQDLTRVISLFPEATKDRMAWKNADFTPTNMSKTYTSRANLYTQLGDYDKAAADFEMAKRVMFLY